jgi:hypothetical protein
MSSEFLFALFLLRSDIAICDTVSSMNAAKAFVPFPQWLVLDWAFSLMSRAFLLLKTVVVGLG